jgi:hypothetical protein
MDGPEEKPRDGESPAGEISPMPSIGLSRREFALRFGGGSAAAIGLAWTAPKITTIRYAAKAQAGSPPPTSTTTTTTVPEGELGHISISSQNPCTGDTIEVKANGFAPGTAVTLQIDSPGHVLGVTTADSAGKIDVQVVLYDHGPIGKHTLKAIGVRTGGRTLTLSTPITVRNDPHCQVENEGSTTTTSLQTQGTVETSPSSTTPTSTPPTSTPPATVGRNPGEKPLGENSLAFTGADAVDLALIGAAAAIGGRVLYGLARPDDDDDEEE